ncbi:hypothetical protein J537_0150 [Acinetobacter baumannii 1437282]|nr:hypothetical protein J537_0150 [Acinetobacter baumannii 1437282]
MGIILYNTHLSAEAVLRSLYLINKGIRQYVRWCLFYDFFA